jgi:DNA-binding XRE family transcriptional regulator
MAYKAKTVDELLEIMEKVRGERTKTQFANDLGVSKQYLSDVYNHRKSPSSTLCASLGYVPETVYVPATAAKRSTKDDPND